MMKKILIAVIALLLAAILPLEAPQFALNSVWNDEYFPTAELPPDAKSVIPRTYPGGVKITNESQTEIHIPRLLSTELNIHPSQEPTVLLYHTHTTEAYNDDGDLWYNSDPHSNDESQNMVHIGAILARRLEEAGIGVVHVRKIHDRDFSSSYNESKKTVEYYTKKYPSIALVIDLHRDSLIDSRGQKYSAVTTVDGREVAQIMLLMGVGNDTYPHPNWEKNMALALQIQDRANQTYPTLMRQILVRPSRYNQHLSPGAILVEVGSCGNTPKQAQAAIDLFADVLIEVLNGQ